jgi:hypothetical protein
MKIHNVKLLMTALTILASSTVNAFYDVEDAQVFQQLTDVKTQLETLYDQYEELQAQTEALTEAEDYHDYFAIIGDAQDFWGWTPSVDELEEMNSAGLQPGKLQDRLKYYESRYGKSKKATDFNENYDPQDPTTHMAAVQADQSASSRFALAVGHESFNRAEDFQEGYEKQLNKLKSVDTMKKSADMSNQLQLQLAQLMNEMLKLQSQQVQMQALLLKEFDTENEFNDTFFKVSTENKP